MGASITLDQFLERESFSKIPAFVDVPDLLSIQTKAYQQFLQEWIPQEAREQIGLEGVFNNVFPDRRFTSELYSSIQDLLSRST